MPYIEDMTRNHRMTTPNKQPTKPFRLVYADGGFEVVEAVDIFVAAEWARQASRRTFRVPVAIHEEK
jgi:hypothetical protein